MKRIRTYYAIAHGELKKVLTRPRTERGCAEFWTHGTYWGCGETQAEADAAVIAVATEPWRLRGLRFRGEVLREDAA